MPECGLCKSKFPCTITVDGKRRDLRRRTRCLKCLPFGERVKNYRKNKKDRMFCKICGKEDQKIGKNLRTCFSCYQKEREQNKLNKIHSVVGENCWLCGYGGSKEFRKILDFHHVDPNEKCFCLHVRNISNLAWNRIIEEVNKCCLLCCRCHREYESGLIQKDKIIKIFDKEWSKRCFPDNR